MLRTTTRRINKLTVAALVVLGFAAICVAQQQPTQEQEKAVGSLCNEFRKIRDLIPRQLLAMITAKHYRYDAKFRHAMKFIPSQEFASAAKAFEESAAYQNILLQFRKAGVQTTDIASIGGILNCLMVTGLTQQQEHQHGKVKEEKVHKEQLIDDKTAKKTQQIKDEQKLQESQPKFEEKAEQTIKEVKEKKLEEQKSQESQPKFEEKPEKQIAEEEYKLQELQQKIEEKPGKQIAKEEYKLKELQQKFEEKAEEVKNKNNEIKKTQNEIADEPEKLKEAFKEETKIKEVEISYNNNNQIDYNDDNWMNDEWMDFDDDNDDFFEVESNKPIRFARSARSRATTTSKRPFYKDIMHAIPRQEFRNLLVQDLAKNPELAMFYKLLRSLAFRRQVQRNLRSASVREPLTVMKKNFIDIPRLTSAIFKVFSWGPRRN